MHFEMSLFFKFLGTSKLEGIGCLLVKGIPWKEFTGIHLNLVSEFQLIR